MRIRSLLIGSTVALLLGSLSANGQQLDIVHAKLDQASASAGLQAAIDGATRSDAGPSWIGYEVPAVADGEGSGHSNRGWNSCSADLEEGSNHTTSFGGPNQPSSRRVLIFLRIHQQQIEKVRMFEGSCRVDADGMPVHWLADVRPAESVELLRSYVQRGYGNSEDHPKGAAVGAIASTDDPSADAAMQQFTSASSPVDLRKEAVFWLGAARGRKGYELAHHREKRYPVTRFATAPSSRFRSARLPKPLTRSSTRPGTTPTFRCQSRPFSGWRTKRE